MDENRDNLQQEETQEERPKYVPRPKSHLVLAWALTAVVVVGVFLQFYWMMKP